jgi:hypothetical protein
MAHAFKKTPFGKSGLGMRLAWAGGLLAVGLTSVVMGAQIGVVHVNAGEMKIVMGKSESGFVMDIAGRNCPPDCGFDINWRPLAGALARTGG